MDNRREKMIGFERFESLATVYHQIKSLLSSPTPPQSIFLQSPSNLDLTLKLLEESLQDLRGTQTNSSRFPNHVQIDLDEILNQKNLFQTILNHLANWYPPFQFSTIQSWNGQVPCHSNTDATVPIWDFETISKQDIKSGAGLLNQKKSHSFDGFCDGLRIITQHLSSSSRSPRFIILKRPELLRGWKELNILSSFTRLAELSGCSIHTIFVSVLPWSKMRPRYGSLDPITVLMPRLSENDLINVLMNDGPPYLSDLMNPVIKTQAMEIFEQFVRFIIAAFNSQTSADLYELSILVNRLWPDWISRMDESGFSAKDTAKMILLSKPMIEVEQKSYGSPVWHLPPFLTKPAALSLEEPSTSTSDDEDTTVIMPGQSPKKSLDLLSPRKSTDQGLLFSPSKTRVNQIAQSPFTTPSKSRHYLSIFSPSSTIHPSSQPPGSSAQSTRHQFAAHLTPAMSTRIQGSSSLERGPVMYERQRFLDTLSLSLPVVARFLLVSAFIASFNPARTDLRMFLTSNEGVQKRKSRGPRKIQPGQVIRAKIRQRLSGPKMFTIGRLLAIFNAITDQEGIKFKEIDVLQQIGTLIQHKLLIKSNSYSRSMTNSNQLDKQLESIKLIVSNLSSSSETIIIKIADSLKFNLLSRMSEAED